jgi:hypothetical protein
MPTVTACAHCSRQMFAGATSGPVPIEPGAFGICASCTAVNVWTGDGWRAPDPAEVQLLEGHRGIAFARSWAMQRLAGRGAQN